MISSLRIRALGVIDDAEIALGPGLVAITGETGAGKTMILTGLSLLAGAKGDAGAVRAGADRAEVDGEWDVDVTAAAGVLERLADAGAAAEVEAVDGNERARIVLARTLADAGRTRAFACGRSVPATVLADVTGELIAVHGQADQQRLRLPAQQRDLLDRFAEPTSSRALARFREAFAQWRADTAALADLLAHRTEREREAALLAHGLAEIDALAPKPGEDEALQAEARVLTNAGALLADVAEARTLLAGDDDDAAGALDLIARARRALDRAATVDAALAPTLAGIDATTSALADLAHELLAYAEAVATDPERQGFVEERRAALSALQRKYGPTLDDVVQWAEQARATVAGTTDVGEREQQLRASIDAALIAATAAAAELTKARTDAAVRLADAVTAELRALAMPDARLVVTVRTGDDPQAWTMSGADDIAFELIPHAGAEPRPLGKGASGGELSRIMLAIEVVLADGTPVPTFVFDEVDAGIGGRAAVEVGKRLARLGRSAQVIVVTHSPQVAAFADTHVVVAKGTDGRITSSSIHTVDGNDRVDELVRMLSGLDPTSAGVAHARELIDAAAAEKAVPAGAADRKARASRPVARKAR